MSCNTFQYHGNLSRYRRHFFEGWYFKHRQGNQVFAAIPGISVNAQGKRTAFIQIITNTFAHYFEFPADDFFADEQDLKVKIGANIFSASGMILQIKQDGYIIKANLKYGAFTSLDHSRYSPDIMGPFSYISFMECYHAVLSLYHTVEGFVQINDTNVSFECAGGYVEKDWGRSFPTSWSWFECHDFSDNPGDSIMLAIAKIPFMGLRFTGIIGVCRIKGKQFRIATYYGAKIKQIKQSHSCFDITVTQRKYMLKIHVELDSGNILSAPVLGQMSRMITEYPACQAHGIFMNKNQILLDSSGQGAGFEHTF